MSDVGWRIKQVREPEERSGTAGERLVNGWRTFGDRLALAGLCRLVEVEMKLEGVGAHRLAQCFELGGARAQGRRWGRTRLRRCYCGTAQGSWERAKGAV